jgi:hypothetical protein
MKKIRLIMMLTLSLIMVFGLSAQQYRSHYVNDNIHNKNYEKQIRKGVKNGLLTGKELRKLRIELAEIDRLKMKALRNGRISHREHRRIDHALLDFEKKLDKYLFNSHRTHKYKMKKRNSIKHRGGSAHRDYDYYYRR